MILASRTSRVANQRSPTLVLRCRVLPSLGVLAAGCWSRRGRGVWRRLGESFVPKAVIGAERFKIGGRAAGGRAHRSSHRLGGRARLGGQRQRFLLSRNRGRFVGKLHAKLRSATACGHPALGRLGKLIGLLTFGAANFERRRRRGEKYEKCIALIGLVRGAPCARRRSLARLSRRFSCVERILCKPSPGAATIQGKYTRSSTSALCRSNIEYRCVAPTASTKNSRRLVPTAVAVRSVVSANRRGPAD